MEIVARFVSNVVAELKADQKNRELAQVAGFRRGARALEKDLEAAAAGAGLGRLARAWDSKAYPETGGSLAAAAVIRVKGGEGTRKAMEAFTTGATVRARNGHYIAIPTDAAPKKGTDGKRITPETFPRGLGPLVLITPRGRPPMLVANNLRARTGKRGGFAAASKSALRTGRGLASVVMFVLVPVARIPQRYAVEGLEAQRRAQVPRYIAEEYARLSQQARR